MSEYVEYRCATCGSVVGGEARSYMSMPLPDIIDRYTITYLKNMRFSPEQKSREPLLAQELQAYEEAIARIRKDFAQVDQWIEALIDANVACWNIEWEIRAGQDGTLSLEEVGKRALQLRTENARRAAVRNTIVHETGHGFFDHKIGHASEVK
jgi:hypothetical protein